SRRLRRRGDRRGNRAPRSLATCVLREGRLRARTPADGRRHDTEPRVQRALPLLASRTHATPRSPVRVVAHRVPSLGRARRLDAWLRRAFPPDWPGRSRSRSANPNGRAQSMNIPLPEFSLVLLVGASGSGKSTFAAKHFKPTEVLSSDWCRAAVSDDPNDQGATKDAFELLQF